MGNAADLEPTISYAQACISLPFLGLGLGLGLGGLRRCDN